jgi:hypothetical protein
MENVETAEAIVVEEILEVGADPNHPLTRAIEAHKQRSLAAKRNAQAMRRAAEGWAGVKTDQDWSAVCAQADDDYASGAFLLQQLGGEASLDPSMTATLLALRQTIIQEWNIETAAECMLVDCTILSYHNALRAERWSNDLAFLIEHELFGIDAPRQHFAWKRVLADGLTAEEHVARMREQLMPLIDRANRMLIRNLKAIRELRHGPAPTIAVGQVNVANRRVNVTR